MCSKLKHLEQLDIRNCWCSCLSIKVWVIEDCIVSHDGLPSRRLAWNRWLCVGHHSILQVPEYFWFVNIEFKLNNISISFISFINYFIRIRPREKYQHLTVTQRTQVVKSELWYQVLSSRWSHLLTSPSCHLLTCQKSHILTAQRPHFTNIWTISPASIFNVRFARFHLLSSQRSHLLTYQRTHLSTS